MEVPICMSMHNGEA